MKIGRIKALDGIRGVAVLMVVYSHVFLLNTPDAKIFSYITLNRFTSKPIIGWGGTGVELFFVLSGFLITGILIKVRKKLHEKQNKETTYSYLFKFYMRRFLRIWPIYFITLIVLLILGNQTIKETWMYTFTFSINYFIASKGYWYKEIAHLWSLAIEQQFYLFWPFIVIYVSKKNFVKLLYALLILSPIVVFFGTFTGISDVSIRVNILSVISYFAAGALLIDHNLNDKRWRVFIWLYVAANILRLADISMYGYDKFLFAISEPIFYAWIIYNSMKGWKINILNNMLNNKIIIFIGHISYAMYIFHYILISYYYKAIEMAGQNLYFDFLIISLISILLASLSKYFIEDPFNSLKKHFKSV